MIYALYKDTTLLGYYSNEREATEFKRIYSNHYPTSNITLVEIFTTEFE